MFNLEHGWLLMREEESERGEQIGYCEKCDKPIYENDDYTKRHGDLICQDCVEKEYEEVEEWE
jgi:formylmethanofuran dehydrogenase subunit E